MVTVKAQCEASAVVVQMGGPRQAGGAGWQRFLCCALSPVLTGRLQTLTHGLLSALLPWRALGTQGTGLTRQQARLPSTPHLAAIPVAIQAAAAVAVFYPGTPMWEGHAPRPAGPREYDHFLAPGASTPWWAAAAVPIDLIHTRGSVGTGRGLALVDVDTAVRTGKARRALAAKPVDAVDTDASVVAGQRVAVIGVVCAGAALPAIPADAGERVSAAHTGASVHTGIGHTAAVLGDSTGAALPARRACAAESVAAVIACATVAAGVGVTLELARVAGLAFPAVVTGTVEVIDQVIAAAAAVAGVGEAVVGIDVTELSFPATGAEATEGVHLVNARAPVAAGLTHAVVDVLVAVGACEAAVTDAGEVSPGQADTVPVRTAHAQGRSPVSPGPCLKPAAIDHSTCPARACLPGHGAVLAAKVFWAGAVVVILKVVAASTIEAGAWFTEIHVHLTVRPREASWAVAAEAIHQVLADATPTAGAAGALVVL